MTIKARIIAILLMLLALAIPATINFSGINTQAADLSQSPTPATTKCTSISATLTQNKREHAREYTEIPAPQNVPEADKQPLTRDYSDLYIPTDTEIDMLAQTIWGEARGVHSVAEQSAVIWIICNRIDAGYGTTVTQVIIRGGFCGYDPSNPVTDEFKVLAYDVVARWTLEREGYQNVGRIIPKDFVFFSGFGSKNIFRNKFKGGTIWDFSRAESPYES